MSIPEDDSGLPEDVRASIHDGSSSPLHGGSSTPAERLTDDLLVEILSRVPALSLCRCKCVSKHWRSLIDHPVHRKKLPQTLAGFFYGSSSGSTTTEESPLPFVSVSGTASRSSAFLPNQGRIHVLDCCNGLLLCRWHISSQGSESRYVVCNPATEKWVVCNPAPEHRPVLPHSGEIRLASSMLGFDPAVPSHFHVFELVEEVYWRDRYLTSVQAYSSETGRWVRREKGLDEAFTLIDHCSGSVFLNGHLYLLGFDPESSYCLATVDTEGKTWISCCVPGGDYGITDGFIQCSQGRLQYANFYRGEHDIVVPVYILNNLESKEWMLKHTVETSELFASVPGTIPEFEWVGIHPECNLMFFMVGSQSITFICYDMDRRQVKVLCNLRDGNWPYLPYVPLYAELQSLHM